MKVSKLWLREWVDFSLTDHALADQLTMAGLEVDAILPVAGDFSQVIVAQVLATKPHPDADKLTLCEVDIKKDQPLRIVCGAANVRPGLKVALAMIGAKLPSGLHIKESKLRGQLSQGMLCSVVELGLAEQSDGIMELEDDAPVGVDLRDYLDLNDVIFDIDLTPNRADCFSVLGIAREVAALNKLPLSTPEIKAVSPSIDDVLEVDLKAEEACSHYCGRVIKNIDPNATTPIWLRERIRRGGIRAIHPVVDILNYVMLELGQPMHAFDLAQVCGSISPRFASGAEHLELLDGQRLELSDKVLVIADQNKPLAMAGIMGGALSSIQSHTQDIFLESAFFNPITIAGVARKYGLFSDSSQRYERGVDPNLQIKALERATGLILSLLGGDAGPITESISNSYLPKPKILTLDATKVLKITGINIPFEEMQVLMQGLGLIILSKEEAIFKIEVPTHRFDLQIEVDLIEEIVRLNGYEKLKAIPMSTVVQSGNSSARECLASELSFWFRTKGYNETISYSFVDPELQEALYPGKEAMQLLNPISSELSQMRLGMWPGLIASMIYNIHRQQNAIRFFEVGVVFEVLNQQLTERPCVAALLTGEQGGLNWNEPTRVFDFYDLKGDIQSLFLLLKLDKVRFLPATHDALHPGQSAQILIDEQPAGWIGVLHPRLSNALDLQRDVLLFELYSDALLKSDRSQRYKTVSKFPQIRRDLSFLVDNQVSALEIEEEVRKVVENDWLKGFHVFDVYMGKGIPEGKKSLAIAITLQDANRTLVDAEINLLISAIIKALESKFSILLRD